MKMKYLVFSAYGRESAYLFPEEVSHKDIAEALTTIRMAPVRGGFVSVWANGDKLMVSAFGEAFSLGLVADKKRDSALIESQLKEVD